MGSSSFYDDPTDYQVIDASTAGSSFYGEGPGYVQVDPDGIKHLKDLAEAAATAAEASNVSAGAHDASAAAHDASATAHDISAAAHDASSALHDSNATASAAAASVSEGNAYVSASNAHASDVSSAANAATATTQAGIATTKASQASTSATNAATSETNSHTSEVNAAASAAAAAATLAGALVKANNLSDLTNVGAAKTNLGLNNVDNTSDVNKPVSTAQQTALDLKQSISGKGTANGYASLDSGGKIPSSQIPAIAITDTYVVASQAAMLALSSAEQGDVAIRTDINKSFILATNSYSTLANWKELLSPTTGVASVAGLTGTISSGSLKTALSLARGDVGLGNVDNTSDVNKPVSTAQQSAIDTKANLTDVRQRLTANRTYYVRPDGSNSNTGLVNNSGGAFLTVQKAIDVVAELDLSVFNVTIQVADGTYTGAVSVVAPWVGFGTVTIAGNNTTPGNVVFSTTSSNAVSVFGPGSRLSIQDLELRTTTSGHCLTADSFGKISFQNIRFGSCAAQHIRAVNFAYIVATGNYSIVGGGQTHLTGSGAGGVNISGRTVTITGTPAFSAWFALAEINGFVLVYGASFSGAASGSRYFATINGAIHSNGGGASFLPGSTGGSVANQGLYV